MKHIINLFIFCIFSITASSQIEVSKILKPSNGECNGTIVFSFVASEIPGTLVVAHDDQSLDGGSISIDGTSYTLKNVCPGDYTFTFIDNHECKGSEYVELENVKMKISIRLSAHIFTTKTLFIDSQTLVVMPI